ncbi:MAG TPA: Na+/H+ antiporter NhaA [Casimicrobiaceae bacterium]|nr:Na+/H+ antiporter NhaA [Casimicrobiaceae bacterium]
MNAEPPSGWIGRFVRLQAAGGIVLVAAAIVAMIWANSPFAAAYFTLFETRMSIAFGAYSLSKPLLLWINDGLMAVFFLLVGLEIKREILEGELSTVKAAALPFIAAFGGMLVPALVYVTINAGNAEALRGWAIPTATDIAFALAVLSLVGNRVPLSLKVFLLALAIIDDFGAIVIIALFYTEKLSLFALSLALVGVAALSVLNRLNVSRLAPYVLCGLFIWVSVLQSGVHATLAGVAIAFAIPLRPPRSEGRSLSRDVEQALHGWVTFGIMPLFALANAGLSLAGVTTAIAVEPVTAGIAAGLFVGKQLGVFTFASIAIAIGVAARPAGAGWLQFYGVAVLTGIGFTMSLFIGTLAFDDAVRASAIRLGVLGGSIASAVLGYLILRFAAPAGSAIDEDARTRVSRGTEAVR